MTNNPPTITTVTSPAMLVTTSEPMYSKKAKNVGCAIRITKYWISKGYKEASWINITIAATTRQCFRRREPHPDRGVACIPLRLNFLPSTPGRWLR